MLVSVYIPTKNRLHLLRRAVQSVLNQTYKNIEIIVVDDGSTDGTQNYLKKQVDAGVLKAIIQTASTGACNARNKAILCASGDFVTGLDDDDYYISEDRVKCFVNTWVSLSDKPAGLFDSVLVATNNGILSRHEDPIVSYQDLREFNLLGSQIFAPKSHYVNAGLFDPLMPAWQDWDLWLRISEKYGDFVNLNQKSYMVDEQHDAERITTRDPERIRNAMIRLASKIPNLTQREKSSLIISLLGYPQVRANRQELISLFLAFRLRSLIYSIRKLVF